MRSEKELFKLATDMVFIEERLQDNPDELVKEELHEEASRISKILLRKNYDVNMFLYYKEFYKTLTVPEYYEFIKTLEE